MDWFTTGAAHFVVFMLVVIIALAILTPFVRRV